MVIEEKKIYDVVIIGAGLAGLTLARQLLIAMPHISIALLHDMSFPNPIAAHKVGESTVEIGAYYLSDVLELSEYLNKEHILKMGLRFIQTEDSMYKELGITDFPWNNAYQLDRGKLENDLYDLIKDKLDIYQGHRFIDFEEGGELKTVKSLTYNGEEKSFQTRWVVDASGRKRCLIKKFSLSTKSPYPIAHSSVWFRVDGVVDINDIYISEDEENIFYQRQRSNSTVHIMGEGYWIWLIPLVDNKTSIGIVFDEDVIDGNYLITKEKAYQFIKNNEKLLYNYLEERAYNILDFKYLRKYSYQSEKFIDKDRWALTGEAFGFADPLYSNGTDLIAFTNTLIRNAIYCDLQDKEQNNYFVEYDLYNKMIVTLYRVFFRCHYNTYRYFDSWYYIFVKTNMDAIIYFGILCVIYMNDFLSLEGVCSVEKREDIKEVISYFFKVEEIFNNYLEYVSSDDFKVTIEKYEHTTRRFLDIRYSVESYINRDIKKGYCFAHGYDEILKDLSNIFAIFEEILARLKEGEDFKDIFYDFSLYQKYFPNARKM